MASFSDINIYLKDTGISWADDNFQSFKKFPELWITMRRAVTSSTGSRFQMLPGLLLPLLRNFAALLSDSRRRRDCGLIDSWAT